MDGSRDAKVMGGASSAFAVRGALLRNRGSRGGPWDWQPMTQGAKVAKSSPFLQIDSVMTVAQPTKTCHIYYRTRKRDLKSAIWPIIEKRRTNSKSMASLALPTLPPVNCVPYPRPSVPGPRE